MSSVHAIAAAAGHSEATVVERSEQGTLLRAGDVTVLVSPPWDPDGSGAVALHPVGPPPPALPPRPVALVAELPGERLVSLQDPAGMRAFARAHGNRLAPLTLIRLLANQATPDGLPQLEGEPAIEARPGGAWRARFATVAHVADGRLVACDWHAELSATGRLAWWMTERR